jgi:hypothetical protein
MMILLLFYYWLLASASKGNNLANIHKNKIEMLVHTCMEQKFQFYGTPFTFINSLTIITSP